MKAHSGGNHRRVGERPGVRPSLCVVIRAEVVGGLDEEFARRLKDLCETVRGSESGCLAYSATRVMGSRTHFAVHARFTGWIALHRHTLTPHMKEALPLLTALMASPVSLEIFMEV
jgi:quinol monooxygenase YgiN